MRDGKVAKIGPNPNHPSSKGAFCVKGIRAVREWTDNENRLLHPLRRVGPRGSGQWKRISWEDALDEMADRLAAARSEYGPLSIAGAVSGGAFSRGAVMALLMRSIGSPNWMINQDLCGGCQALGEKLTGTPMKNGEDIDNARCAVLVGRKLMMIVATTLLGEETAAIACAFVLGSCLAAQCVCLPYAEEEGILSSVGAPSSTVVLTAATLVMAEVGSGRWAPRCQRTIRYDPVGSNPRWQPSW